MKQTKIKITGMHCQSCVTLLDKVLNKEKGVESANVNFSTEKATIKFNPKFINDPSSTYLPPNGVETAAVP